MLCYATIIMLILLIVLHFYADDAMLPYDSCCRLLLRDIMLLRDIYAQDTLMLFMSCCYAAAAPASVAAVTPLFMLRYC